MKWPWSKNTQKTVETEKPSPTPGAWCEFTRCHCGHDKKWEIGLIGYYAMGEYDVCPKCGHKDKWETFVGRRRVWDRMGGIERWTPESCTIKDENEG
jgi:hypothetical protein